MSDNSRTQKSLRILFSNYVSRITDILISFINRSVFIYMLGAEYLGLNGLFSSVLSMLSLAELGVGNAITFHLYKPICHGDYSEIKKLVRFYKKCYTIIGAVIFAIGLLIVPILPHIVNFDTNIDINLYVIYMLYLFNSVSSYWFFAYYRTVIYAYQRQDVIYQIEIIYKICSGILCTLGLLITGDYYLYLFVQIGATFIKNIMIRYNALKLYPYLKEKTTERLSREKIRMIMRDMYSIMFSRVSSTLSSSFDSLIVSAFVSTKMVGYISNYVLIQNSVLGFTNAVTGSVTASIGNLVAEGDKKKQYEIYKQLDFINFYLIYFVCVCVTSLATPFITLWAGESFVVSKNIVLCIVFNATVCYSLNVTWAFKDGMGLFKYGRSAQMIQGITNLGLSIILCKTIGTVGVYFASLITNIVIAWPMFTYNLFKYGFLKKSKERFLLGLKRCVFTLATVVLLQMIIKLFITINVLTFLAMVVICITISNLAFYIIFRNETEWNELKNRVINIFKLKR